MTHQRSVTTVSTPSPWRAGRRLLLLGWSLVALLLPAAVARAWTNPITDAKQRRNRRKNALGILVFFLVVNFFTAPHTVHAWTDDLVTPGSTRIKAVHVTELQTQINAARAAAKIFGGACTSLDPINNWASIAVGTVIHASDFSQMRDAIQEVYVATGGALPSNVIFSPYAGNGGNDPLAPGNVIRAQYIMDLRQAVDAAPTCGARQYWYCVNATTCTFSGVCGPGNTCYYTGPGNSAVDQATCLANAAVNCCAASCGDGTCCAAAGETTATCPADCPCQANGLSCAANADCCSGTCSGGICGGCSPNQGNSCTCGGTGSTKVCLNWIPNGIGGFLCTNCVSSGCLGGTGTLQCDGATCGSCGAPPACPAPQC